MNKEQNFYRKWVDMKARCDNPKRSNYKYYGAKGIGYSQEWERFESFKEDMWKAFELGLTLDRIDSDEDYSKSNCQWITMAEQNRKHRKCRYFTLNGETKILSDWAREKGLKPDTVRHRIKRGWTIEEAFKSVIDTGRW